ncbi:unnamed protein product [marine sediment metagenome]|uniref:Uncharacterized protein n=1 Tax=marine sediment metagenome TaxID=412755 RepID=X1HZ29_9ZZZZ
MTSPEEIAAGRRFTAEEIAKKLEAKSTGPTEPEATEPEPAEPEPTAPEPEPKT